MKRIRALGLMLAAVASVSGTLIAQTPAPDVEQVDAATQARLDEAVERGRMIYAYDLAAAVSSDEMRRLMSQEQINPSRGWVVEPIEEELRVTYYGLEGETPYAVAVFDVNDETVTRSEISEAQARPPLSTLGQRMASARSLALETASEAEYMLCDGPRPHTVVFPPDPLGVMSVYILTPQNDPDIYPVGGHFRVDIGRNGEVVQHRRFLNTCLAQDLSPEGSRGRPEGFVLSHLLDPIPTEIHALVARWTGTPVYVLTTENRRIWRVEADAITHTSTLDEASEPESSEPAGEANE